MTNLTNALALAKAFHAEVRTELSEHLEAIDASNALREEGDTWCSTHDYCDANMLMDAAFTKVFAYKIDLKHQIDFTLWNAAWAMAQNNGFNKEWSE